MCEVELVPSSIDDFDTPPRSLFVTAFHFAISIFDISVISIHIRLARWDCVFIITISSNI